MWPALLWAFFIGLATTADKSGMSPAILAFIAISYFAWKANEIMNKGNAIIAGLNSKIQSLEASLNGPKWHEEKEPDPMSPGYQAEIEYRNAKRNGLI